MLERYQEMRDFSRTREPASGRPGRGNLTFVVQKHAARRLHYDFRLELDGVLKSWAVPKGPSLDPSEKRLAALVEDHPLDYASFEGVIGHGNYGAGQVIVWDEGVYSPDEDGLLSFGDREGAEDRMRRGLESGKLSFTLRGRKLHGSWTLVRTSRSPRDWLLIKHKDGYVDTTADVLESDRSVHSGLTIEDLKAGRLPDQRSGPGPIDDLLAGGRKAPFPDKLKPMLARLTEDAFSHPDWVFEPKLDGFRALAFIHGGEVRLASRTGTDLTPYFAQVVADLEAQAEDSMVLDGEIVAVDEKGMPSFGLLQNSLDIPRIGKSARNPEVPAGPASIVYYPFDLLYLRDISLVRLPLVERKALLRRVLIPGRAVKPVEFVEGDGQSFFEASQRLGLEGMVAKRRDAAYEPGVRSASWLKVKGQRSDEFVIGGYTGGTGARAKTFGALLLGQYDGEGHLTFSGKVGSGFDQTSLQQLTEEFERLGTDESPFLPDAELGKLGAHWLRPELVARVKFAQWTREGRLRAPVFMGLRSDVAAMAVTGEETASPPPSRATVHADSAEHVSPSSSEVLEQLVAGGDALIVEVDGHRISLTNLGKALWPASADRGPVTKRDMIRYYASVAPVLLPHLRDRPFTLTRYPDGIDGESFYQKHWEHRLPEFVETVKIFSSHNEGDRDFILVNNLPTLIWLAQVADIELHPWLSRVSPGPDTAGLTDEFTGSEDNVRRSVLNYPDFVVFDLDPYIYSGKEREGDEPELNRGAFAKTVEVALALKDILDELSLSSFLKTSGKTGLHVYVPVLRQFEYRVTRKACEVISRFLMQGRPQDVTMEWTVSKRPGKVFLDHNQNVRGKNMASIYSLRPLPGAPVSTPLRWDELGEIFPTDFTIDTVPPRIEAMGDLWAGALDVKHDLSRLLERE